MSKKNLVKDRSTTMDYSAILQELDNASLFELFRLNEAIRRQLEDPKRIAAIKNRLKVGQMVNYFDSDQNRMVEASIVKFKRTLVLVKKPHDGERWNILFYHINLDNLATDILLSNTKKLDRNSLLVGDTRWRVGYGLLSMVIDGELDADNTLIESEVITTKKLSIQ